MPKETCKGTRFKKKKIAREFISRDKIDSEGFRYKMPNHIYDCFNCTLGGYTWKDGECQLEDTGNHSVVANLTIDHLFKKGRQCIDKKKLCKFHYDKGDRKYVLKWNAEDAKDKKALEKARVMAAYFCIYNLEDLKKEIQ